MAGGPSLPAEGTGSLWARCLWGSKAVDWHPTMQGHLARPQSGERGLGLRIPGKPCWCPEALGNPWAFWDNIHYGWADLLAECPGFPSSGLVRPRSHLPFCSGNLDATKAMEGGTSPLVHVYVGRPSAPQTAARWPQTVLLRAGVATTL